MPFPEMIRFDEQLVPECSVDDLDAALTDRFRTGRSDVARMTFLQKLGMVGKENGNLRPTVAGVLLGTRDPRRWLPNAFIQAVAYIGDAIATGDDAPYQLDALDITGRSICRSSMRRASSTGT